MIYALGYSLNSDGIIRNDTKFYSETTITLFDKTILRIYDGYNGNPYEITIEFKRSKDSYYIVSRLFTHYLMDPYVFKYNNCKCRNKYNNRIKCLQRFEQKLKMYTR